MDFDLFAKVFGNMFIAVIKIFIVALAGGIMVRRKLLTQEHIQGLSEATVKIFLPSLVITNILTSFDPWQTHDWWILPLIGMIMPIILLLIISLFYIGNLRGNLSKIPLAAFQNAGYLVLPVGQVIFPDKFQKFALYVFLLVLGFTPVLWSLGKILITGEASEKLKLKGLFTPPFVANILAVAMVFLHLNKIPSIIFDPLELLGSATIPVATFILGATLGSVSFKKLPPLKDILKIFLVKYLIAPALFIFILLLTKLGNRNPLMADFLIIEASAAPAANLIVMVRKYGGDAQFTGSMMLLMYFAAIITMPTALAVWTMVNV